MVDGTRQLELLAPAGDALCLRAAVTAGADAVYLGLDEFNARRNAGNFTLETLREACTYAHLRGVSVYVAMNVQILPSELDRALTCAEEAWAAGADALIVQDIGLAAALRRRNPAIPLHISTQMNTHNTAGIEFAAALGASRVTLARELHLNEVAALAGLAADMGMEVECFAHGALCVCYSGQCLMSSMIGGRSANRGLCAQPCRLPYSLHREGCDEALPVPGEHLLSPRDLCTADLTEALAAAGVRSLKIEGRMKSADYVYQTVGTYREILDNGGLALPGHRARLDEAFSRGFTTAYLEGQRGNDAMGYGRPNNRGVFVGRVTGLAGGKALVQAERALSAGDIVEFWTNRGHFTCPVDAPCEAGGIAALAAEKPVGKGDRVFRVRNSASAFPDEPFEPRIAVAGEITLRRGQPAHLVLRTADGTQAEAWGDTVEPARTKALTADEVREHVGRSGQTPFRLADGGLAVSLDEGVGMGFSVLHRLRTRALEALERELLAPYRRPDAVPMAQRQPVAAAGTAPAPAQALICVWTTNPGTARAAKRAGADRLYVPLLNFRRGQGLYAGVRSDRAEQAGYPKQCIMALPTIDHDPVEGAREYRCDFDFWDYVREGKPVFADNIGDAWRALQMGAEVELGPRVPVTNRATLEFLGRLGIARVWLSPELTLGQIADLAADSPVPLGLFISGAQELMVMEHCVLMSRGACAENCGECPRRAERHHLHDRKGFDFPVVTDMLGRTHLYNGVELDGVPTLCDLQAAGVSAFMVDTTLLERDEAAAAVKRALRARGLCAEGRTLERRPNTTTGHLFRGVQ